ACLRCWSEDIKNRQLHNIVYSLSSEYLDMDHRKH
ncbi:hypothetical protein YPPY47_2920, partial [Yersinia pestis PY-47]